MALIGPLDEVTLAIDRRGRLAADFEGNQFTARQLGDYVEVLISER